MNGDVSHNILFSVIIAASIVNGVILWKISVMRIELKELVKAMLVLREKGKMGEDASE